MLLSDTERRYPGSRVSILKYVVKCYNIVGQPLHNFQISFLCLPEVTTILKLVYIFLFILKGTLFFLRIVFGYRKVVNTVQRVIASDITVNTLHMC